VWNHHIIPFITLYTPLLPYMHLYAPIIHVYTPYIPRLNTSKHLQTPDIHPVYTPIRQVARIVMMKDGLLPEAVLVARGEITTYGNRLFQRRELIVVGGCPRGAWGDLTTCGEERERRRERREGLYSAVTLVCRVTLLCCVTYIVVSPSRVCYTVV
jgi:hypothetical protein